MNMFKTNIQETLVEVLKNVETLRKIRVIPEFEEMNCLMTLKGEQSGSKTYIEIKRNSKGKITIEGNYPHIEVIQVAVADYMSDTTK